MSIPVVKTAGMVTGTPDWQLDRLYEIATEKKLHDSMFTDDDFPATNIADFLSQVDYFIGQADIKLARAGDLAEGWDRAKGIDGLIERLEELRCDINSERRKLCGNR